MCLTMCATAHIETAEKEKDEALFFRVKGKGRSMIMYRVHKNENTKATNALANVQYEAKDGLLLQNKTLKRTRSRYK